MPPKRAALAGTGGRPAQQQKGYARYLVSEVTNPENRSVVTSIAFFAVRIQLTNTRAAMGDGEERVVARGKGRRVRWH